MDSRRGSAGSLALALLTIVAVPAPRAWAEPAAGPPKPGREVLVSPGGGPPYDYARQRTRLTRSRYPKIMRRASRIIAHDGMDLYMEIVRPDPRFHGNGPWPVILEASPYHGTLADRKGIRIFPDPMDSHGRSIGLTGYFAPRGYAVVMMDLRGTGRSGGCVDHLGPNDARDLKRVVEWAAGQPWSTGRVALTGHSYVGSTPSVAAAQRPRGLVTIVPSAGLASMYDHQFQLGVPYNLQWAGPMFAYAGLGTARHAPPGTGDRFGYRSGDDFGNHPSSTGCGWSTSSLTAGPGQATGQYEAWHRVRDWRRKAASAPIPIFLVHGVNDDAARIPAAAWFLGSRFGRRADKVWVGQWDHGASGQTSCRAGGHPNCRSVQWKYALHAWFDKHLKQRPVDTGPAVEAFLNGKVVYTGRSWTKPGRYLTLYPQSAPPKLTATAPRHSGQASFAPGRFFFFGRPAQLTFESGVVGHDLVLLGIPRLELWVSVTDSQLIHLIVTLSRLDAEGLHPMGYCAIQPQLRGGVSKVSPVLPRVPMRLAPACFTMAHRLHPRDRVVMTVSSESPHHVTFAADTEVTVHTGPAYPASLRLPVAGGRALYPDPLSR